jgi:8-oxo-dGTP pyrophosphatase MutT (NUDIX family)
MWLVTTLGFFSIVQKPGDKAAGLLTVRARVRSDLEALRDAHLPALGAIKETTNTDYRFRAQAPHAAVVAAMAQLVAQIDYGNFKDAVADRQGGKRAKLYHHVWHALLDLQGNAEQEPPRSAPALQRQAAFSVQQADAYGGVVVDSEGRVLLREPSGHFGGYVWTFPKGRPDDGETPAEAALREVREETGYDARIVGVVPGVFGGTTSTTAYFLMEPTSAQQDFESETAQTRWVSFVDAPSLIAMTKSRTGRERDMKVLAAAKEALEALRRRSR